MLYSVTHGFFAKSEAAALINSFRPDVPLEDSPGHNGFWAGRTQWNEAPPYMLKKLREVRDIAEMLFRQELWLTDWHLCVWPDGHGGLAPHDDYGIGGEFPWREYSGTITLNDEYEGGRTVLVSAGVSVERGAGDLLLFRGGGEEGYHGVEPIEKAPRFTIPFWLSDKRKWPDPPTRRTLDVPPPPE